MRRTEREEAKHERGYDCEVRERMQDDRHPLLLSEPPVDPTLETELRDRSQAEREPVSPSHPSIAHSSCRRRVYNELQVKGNR